MKPIKTLQLGKNGITPNFVNQVESLFEKEELIKISILKSACRNKKEAEKLGEELVKSLGKKFNYKLIGYVLAIRKFRKNQR